MLPLEITVVIVLDPELVVVAYPVRVVGPWAVAVDSVPAGGRIGLEVQPLGSYVNDYIYRERLVQRQHSKDRLPVTVAFRELGQLAEKGSILR